MTAITFGNFGGNNFRHWKASCQTGDKRNCLDWATRAIIPVCQIPFIFPEATWRKSLAKTLSNIIV
jgi:hypothetical protein